MCQKKILFCKRSCRRVFFFPTCIYWSQHRKNKFRNKISFCRIFCDPKNNIIRFFFLFKISRPVVIAYLLSTISNRIKFSTTFIFTTTYALDSKHITSFKKWDNFINFKSHKKHSFAPVIQLFLIDLILYANF